MNKEDINIKIKLFIFEFHVFFVFIKIIISRFLLAYLHTLQLK